MTQKSKVTKSTIIRLLNIFHLEAPEQRYTIKDNCTLMLFELARFSYFYDYLSKLMENIGSCCVIIIIELLWYSQLSKLIP